jgi:hypothetical protein
MILRVIPLKQKAICKTFNGITLTFPVEQLPNKKKKEKTMNFKSIKDAYIYGFKEGILIGMDKGMDLASVWCEESSECPPNTAPMIESTATEE